MKECRPKRIKHLLIRFSDSFMDIESTVENHQAVIAKQESVWFGKVGRPLRQSNVDAFNRQIEQDISTYLFLTQNKGRPGKPDYEYFQCQALQVESSLPENETKRFPKYYKKKEIDLHASLWIRIDRIKKIDAGEFNNFCIASSNRSIQSALSRSLAGMFIVAEEKPIVYY